MERSLVDRIMSWKIIRQSERERERVKEREREREREREGGRDKMKRANSTFLLSCFCSRLVHELCRSTRA